MLYRLFLLIIIISCPSFSQTKRQLLHSKILEYSSQFKSSPDLKKASLFFRENNWDSTLIYTQKQLNINTTSNKIIELCNYFRGISFCNKGIYEEAKNHLTKVSNDFVFSNINQFYLSYIYMRQKKYLKAEKLLITLLKSNQKEFLYIDRNKLLRNLGTCYISLGKYHKSETYFKKSFQNTKDSIQLIEDYNNVANIYYNLYKDNLAISYFKKAYQLSKKVGDFDLKKTTAKNMSVVEENRKDFKKALVYRKEMLKWSDSLNNQNRIYEVAKKEKEFAVKEKQKEVDFLQVENELKETQRNNVIYIASVLLLLLFVSVYFYREKVKRNKIIAEQKENLDALNNTKDKLFSIVSHDLRSSVNALKTSNTVLLDNLQSKNINALEGLLQKNSAIVNGAYGLLDNLLNWALLQTNQGYFHIESLRLFIIVEHVAYNYKPLLFEKELSFENSISKKALIYADQESLKIILRNLLDNAIKFSKPNGALKVYSEEAGDFWNLIVEDTGLGMSEATRQELLKDSALLHKKEHEEVLGTGLGLSLVKSMIHKNHGKFNIKSELGKGTKMIVSLPKTQPNG